MTKFTYMLAGASLLAIAGSVSAEPMALSSSQMDGISAGSGVICGCPIIYNPSPIPGLPTPSVPLIRFIPIVPTIPTIPTIPTNTIAG